MLGRTFVVMKWLTTVLVLYLLGLSLWPCADEALPLTGQAGRAMLTSAPVTARHHNHHDQCSPFCTCACCAATVTTPPPFLSLPAVSAPMSRPAVVLTAMYPADLPAGLLFAIWQPPKHRV